MRRDLKIIIFGDQRIFPFFNLFDFEGTFPAGLIIFYFIPVRIEEYNYDTFDSFTVNIFYGTFYGVFLSFCGKRLLQK